MFRVQVNRNQTATLHISLEKRLMHDRDVIFLETRLSSFSSKNKVWEGQEL